MTKKSISQLLYKVLQVVQFSHWRQDLERVIFSGLSAQLWQWWAAGHMQPERARGAMGSRGNVLLELMLYDPATVFHLGQEAGHHDRCFSLATSRITISDGVWYGKRVVCGSWLDHAFFSFTSLDAALVAFLWHGVTGSGCTTALGKAGL